VDGLHHETRQGQAHHLLGRKSPTRHKPARIGRDQAMQVAATLQMAGQVEGVPASAHEDGDAQGPPFGHG
ncbi:MAG: hypothetical protein ACK55I_35440, partial [bacterium]